MPNSATISLEGVEMIFGLSAKNFSTGSRGYYGQGKLELTDGSKKFQVSIICTEIGSKPKEK